MRKHRRAPARLASILSQRHMSSPMEPVFAFPMMNLFPDRNLLPPEASTSVVLWLASDEASTELAAPSPSMPDR